MYRYNLFSALLFVFILGACKKKTEQITHIESRLLNRIEMSDAEFFVAIPNGNNVNYIRTLYKVNEEGSLDEVQNYSVNDKLLESAISPLIIRNVNNDYMIFSAQVKSNDDIVFNSNYFLIRKSDGQIYPIQMNQNVYALSIYQDFEIYTDADNNIYFPAANRTGTGIFKLNINNINNLSAIEYTSSDESVDNFAVDSKGNMIFSSWLGGDYVSRVKLKNGAVETIPGTQVQGITLGTDDNFYIEQIYNPGLQYQKLIINGNSIEYIDFGIHNSRLDIATTFGKFYKATNGTKSVSFSFPVFAELDPVNNTVLGYTHPLDEINYLSYSNTYFYVTAKNGSEQGALYKVPRNNFGGLSFVNNALADYSIKKAVSSKNDVLVFSGIRLNDGKTVVARVDLSGTITVLKEDFINIDEVVITAIK